MSEPAGLIVSVSGIRGIIGDSLLPETASAFAAALGTAAAGQAVVVSRDSRPSGNMLRHAVLAGLLNTGCKVYDLGIVSTPTCGLALSRLRAAAGIQITASHNPAPWNGLKLFSRDGAVLSATEGRRLADLFRAGNFRRVGWNALGSVEDCRDAADWHRQRVMELVDIPRLRSRQLRVFLDANGGAGGPLGRQLLDALQIESVCQACSADGHFLHEPEPTAENVKEIGPLVTQHGCDIGFVLDPDADRLALIDETGRYIGEELTLALAVLFRLRQQTGPVVLNMSTSRISEDIAREMGCPCYRSAVGEANVVEKMRQVGAVIGGEGNGGVIDPRVGWVRDPFIGMALILNLLADSERPLSSLLATLPQYAIVKQKYEVEAARLPGLFTGLRQQWPDAQAILVDGLRLDWQDRWLHVRPSNTEPVVRVISEAPTQQDAQSLCDEVARSLRVTAKHSE